MPELTDLSATDLLAGYQAAEFDPTEVISACLERIEQTEPVLHAAVTRAEDSARAAASRSAERWRTGSARPLEGLPFGVKDIIETAGIRTTAGSMLFADHVPTRNAAVVDRLVYAGAVLVTKTATPEFAFGDSIGDDVVNPWGDGRWTGGSSSGSAVALAACQVPLAIGSDTGGSIRVPASYCGVSGIKPTFGRVPRDGVFPVSWTLDHTGPMARSVADLVLTLQMMAGPSASDPRSSTRPVPDYGRELSAHIDGVRVGVPEGWLVAGCSAGVLKARDDAIRVLTELGATVVEVEIPHAELAGIVAWLITVVEFAANHDHDLDRLDELTASAAHRVVAGNRTGARDYLKAMRARRLVQGDFDALFEHVDVVLTPATPSAAPDLTTFFDDGDRLWLDKVARTFLMFNVTGMPALVVPAGFDDGLPVAIQIAARPHCDALCLRVGHAYQQVTDHHLRRPDLLS